MKWRKQLPRPYEARKITTFAFLPIEIRGEVRWFETVTIHQSWKVTESGGYWIDVEFID